jgi:hypothetical protein
MLAILIAWAKEDGQIGTLAPHLVDGGIPIIQCEDDTKLFMEHDLAKAVNMKLIIVNMKLIMCFFEQLSDLKINFHKSKIFRFGKVKQE